MTIDTVNNIETKQPQTAYTTLSGDSARKYLKDLKLDPSETSKLHFCLGRNVDVPEAIARYVPSTLEERFKYYRDNPETASRAWYSFTNTELAKQPDFNLIKQITPDNLANMFATDVTVIREGSQSMGRLPVDMAKSYVTSGDVYADLFTYSINALRVGGAINNDQVAEIYENKMAVLQESLNDVLNFRFEGSIPLSELRALAESHQDDPRLQKAVGLIELWDKTQEVAVKQISETAVTKTKIAGLLTTGTPGVVVDMATAMAETQKKHVDSLAQWSREIPADAVYEALTTYGQLDEPSRDKINQLVMAKRSFKAIKGEMTINSGVPTEQTARQMKELQAVLKLDSINMFEAKAEERALLEQRLSAWVGITSQDKRVHVEELKPILKQEKGVDALDILNATATYLLSISKSLGKMKQ